MMTLTPLLSPALRVAAGLVAGGAAGAAYFAALLANTRWYARGAIGAAVAVQLLRFAVLGAVLYGLARLGALALLGGLAGIVAARHAVVRTQGAPR
ncbi:conserved membrane protein of unknown function [Burkholderia multivorans]